MVINKKGLVAAYCEAEENKSKYFALIVKSPSSIRPEVLINPIVNMKVKIAFIDRTYNNNLVMHNNCYVKIIGFVHGKDYNEVCSKLGGMQNA